MHPHVHENHLESLKNKVTIFSSKNSSIILILALATIKIIKGLFNIIEPRHGTAQPKNINTPPT